jgi:hypothetical protein
LFASTLHLPVEGQRISMPRQPGISSEERTSRLKAEIIDMGLNHKRELISTLMYQDDAYWEQAKAWLSEARVVLSVDDLNEFVFHGPEQNVTIGQPWRTLEIVKTKAFARVFNIDVKEMMVSELKKRGHLSDASIGEIAKDFSIFYNLPLSADAEGLVRYLLSIWGIDQRERVALAILDTDPTLLNQAVALEAQILEHGAREYALQLRGNEGVAQHIAIWENKVRTILEQAKDLAMKGGIDLTSDKTLTIQSNGEEGIKFHIDPAQLAQLKNASGFVPIIINIQPMTDLRRFMGLEEASMPHS